MRKNHLIVVVILLFAFLIYSKTGNIYAEELNNNVETIEKDDLQSKKEILDEILKSKEEIKQELVKIESKLSNIKEKDEYINYPAIRLNIDTPIFGLTSVCNQKLKITSEVSTADVASGYSIKDIVKNNSLKVPSFSVGSIVVITRDIRFDENITLIDASTCILKLMQYIEQAKNVNDFLDKQIIKIYSKYIPKSKSQKIQELQTRLEKVRENLNNNDKDLVKLYISNLDIEKYNTYLNKYIEINNNIYNYKKILENVLISDEAIAECENKIILLESDYNTFDQELKSFTLNIAEKIDFEVSLAIIRNDFVAKRDNIQKYINNSKIEKPIEQLNNLADVNDQNNDTIAQNNSEVSNEIIKLYNVTSESIVQDIEKNIEYIDNKINEILGQTVLNKIKGINLTETNEEILNKTEVNNIVIKELSVEEKNSLLEELYNTYKEVLSKEDKFYLDNTNLLLKDTTDKISSLSKYTNYYQVSNIRYIYLELPNLLEKEMDIYSLNYCIEIKKFTSSIIDKLNKLVEINKQVTQEYNEKISKDINSRENN